MDLSEDAEEFFSESSHFLSEYYGVLEGLDAEHKELNLFLEAYYGGFNQGLLPDKPKFLDFEHGNSRVDIITYSEKLDEFLGEYQQILERNEYRDIPGVHNENRIEDINQFREKYIQNKMWV